MIVDSASLDVLPVSDEVLRAVAGEYESEVEVEDLLWSNELVLHVIELKTNGPAKNLNPLPEIFHDHVGRVNRLLVPLGGRLMPTSTHPWMNPDQEMRLWPHQDNEIYDAFNRIFDCRGHGWANLQCSHLNLPFAGDEEFGRLHAAVRLLLPIIPAIAASSPLLELKPTGMLDTRLDLYRKNSGKIPSITGRVIPEPVFTPKEYDHLILQRLYRDIAPHDPEGILRHEWLNARGAIARFERSTIEIRIIDIQECPMADLSIIAAIVRVIEAMVSELWCDVARQKSFGVEELERVMLTTMTAGESAVISDRKYLDALGFRLSGRCTAGELWQHLVETLFPATREETAAWRDTLLLIIKNGTLSSRILRALGGDLAPERVSYVYRGLCDCLAEGRIYTG